MALSKSRDERPGLRDASAERGFALPANLGPLVDEIELSRRILELGDDWDGEGAPRYSELTWDRAVRFLTVNARALWDAQRIVAPMCRILPGPQGSIDLHWLAADRELLVNVAPDPCAAASFHGDDRHGQAAIGGELSLESSAQWLLLWIAAM
ncbi:MAG: hypothetical protein ACR2OO_13805 [Thermomicrobiales bacterium]